MELGTVSARLRLRRADGRIYLDRLEKLEAVVEAARSVMNHPAAKARRIQPAQGRALNQALDALDSEEDGPCPIAR